jgi:formylglycine-generating enzyme required for sulfatase activity
LLATSLLVAAGGCVRYQGAASSGARGPEPTAGRGWAIPGLHLKLAYVAPGGFQMGSEDGEPDERPVHAVRLSRGFWIGRTEVTQAQYWAVMRSDTASAADEGTAPSPVRNPHHPVDTVSWDAAMAFCAKLTAHELARGRLPSGYEYRLPTEAEWEYAARGGVRSAGYRFSGANTASPVAWHAGNSGNAARPVAQKEPNELGLYDMSGNVWEWCLDPYDPGYYAAAAATDPVNLSPGTTRVFRGGCWGFPSEFARATCRSRLRPGTSCDGLGFRIVLAAPVGTGPATPGTPVPAAAP